MAFVAQPPCCRPAAAAAVAAPRRVAASPLAQRARATPPCCLRTPPHAAPRLAARRARRTAAAGSADAASARALRQPVALPNRPHADTPPLRAPPAAAAAAGRRGHDGRGGVLRGELPAVGVGRRRRAQVSRLPTRQGAGALVRARLRAAGLCASRSAARARRRSAGCSGVGRAWRAALQQKQHSRVALHARAVLWRCAPRRSARSTSRRPRRSCSRCGAR
jgi:hypothetical protein